MPSFGDLPNPGIEPRSSALQVDSLPSVPPGKRQDTIARVKCNGFPLVSLLLFIYLFFFNQKNCGEIRSIKLTILTILKSMEM